VEENQTKSQIEHVLSAVKFSGTCFAECIAEAKWPRMSGELVDALAEANAKHGK
jgi:hypothetical protein